MVILTATTSAAVQKPLLRRAAGGIRRWLLQRLETQRWIVQGRPAPAPPHVKRVLLRRLLQENGLRVFVETGTFYGDTLTYLSPWCDELYSIELGQELFERASEHFANNRKVHILLGDSGDLMPDLLKMVTRPALFWLDGHYSGTGTARGIVDTPILRELVSISNHHLLGKHLVVVDDARCFGIEQGYPSIPELKDYVLSIGFTHFEMNSDYFFIR